MIMPICTQSNLICKTWNIKPLTSLSLLMTRRLYWKIYSMKIKVFSNLFLLSIPVIHRKDKIFFVTFCFQPQNSFAIVWYFFYKRICCYICVMIMNSSSPSSFTISPRINRHHSLVQKNPSQRNPTFFIWKSQSIWN
jgi:hypothetical protein